MKFYLNNGEASGNDHGKLGGTLGLCKPYTLRSFAGCCLANCFDLAFRSANPNSLTCSSVPQFFYVSGVCENVNPPIAPVERTVVFISTVVLFSWFLFGGAKSARALLGPHNIV